MNLVFLDLSIFCHHGGYMLFYFVVLKQQDYVLDSREVLFLITARQAILYYI